MPKNSYLSGGLLIGEDLQRTSGSVTVAISTKSESNGARSGEICDDGALCCWYTMPGLKRSICDDGSMLTIQISS